MGPPPCLPRSSPCPLLGPVAPSPPSSRLSRSRSTPSPYARSWCVNSPIARVRLAGENERLEAEVALLREELRIKDRRLARVDPHQRPHYPPAERLAILELRAARGWSASQTARAMLVTADTIASWSRRVDEQGPAALVQTAEPVNRFPDFVRHTVMSLKRLCPAMGKRRIAQILARAGLHLGVTTVRRMLRERRSIPPGSSTPPTVDPDRSDASSSRPVTARYPNHLWQVDLTLLPRVAGLWVPWFPFALPQCWPFVWWTAVAVDHFSRRVTGWCLFPKQPSSVELRAFLGRSTNAAGAVPRYLVSDKGKQFCCADYRDWCERQGIHPRYASTGSLRATAIIERFFLSLKTEMPSLVGTALTRRALQQKLALYFQWFAEHRPHQGLGGRTPRELYHRLDPANEQLRFEPRARWPRRSGCARPEVKHRKDAFGELALVVHFLDREQRLPIISLRHAA